MKPLRFAAAFSSAIALLCAGPVYGQRVSLDPEKSGPTPVGTAVNWNASTGETPAGDNSDTENPGGPIWYRYRVRTPGRSEFRVLRDFSPQSSFKWVPSGSEGLYEVEVTARQAASGDTSSAVSTYEVSSLTTGESPVITPTSNELVFLYSAPPCQPGSRMTVNYAPADGPRQVTPPLNCVEGKSLNVYLAGLREDTEYTVQH